MESKETQEEESQGPCSGLRKELKECILASDCVRKVKLTAYLVDDRNTNEGTLKG